MRAAWAILAVTALAATAAADRRDGEAVTVVHEPNDEVPTIGPRHAPVTVEFFCNFNGQRNDAQFYKLLQELADRHPRRLRIEFHIIGNEYSEAAYEAFVQGKFFAFADAAFSQRHRFRREHIDNWAEAADMNLAQLHAARDDGRHKPAIERAAALRVRRGSRTRRVFFNGEETPHVLKSIEEFEVYYDQHYTRAKQLLDDGVPLEDLFDRMVRDAELRRARPSAAIGKYDQAPGQDPPPLEAPKLADGDLALEEHPSRGPADARAVVAVYCSLQSGNCRQLWDRVEKARRVYPDDVRVVFVPLFHEEIHPDARGAHEAVLCAGEQGKQWELLDELFRLFRPNQLDIDSLAERATNVDIDADAMRACVEAHTYTDAIDDAMRTARAAGVRYTPSVAIGRRIYIGVRTHDDVLAMVADALRPGLLERARDLRRQILEALTPGAVDRSDPTTPER